MARLRHISRKSQPPRGAAAAPAATVPPAVPGGLALEESSVRLAMIQALIPLGLHAVQGRDRPSALRAGH
jgi:hypothetical protein